MNRFGAEPAWIDPYKRSTRKSKSPSRWMGFCEVFGGLGRNRTIATRILNANPRARRKRLNTQQLTKSSTYNASVRNHSQPFSVIRTRYPMSVAENVSETTPETNTFIVPASLLKRPAVSAHVHWTHRMPEVRSRPSTMCARLVQIHSASGAARWSCPCPIMQVMTGVPSARRGSGSGISA
jgi:hypothetical protein